MRDEQQRVWSRRGTWALMIGCLLGGATLMCCSIVLCVLSAWLPGLALATLSIALVLVAISAADALDALERMDD